MNDLIQCLDFSIASLDLPGLPRDVPVQRLDFSVALCGLLGVPHDGFVQGFEMSAQFGDRPVEIPHAVPFGFEICGQVVDFPTQVPFVLLRGSSEKQRAAEHGAQFVQAVADAVQRIPVRRPFVIDAPPLQNFVGLGDPMNAVGGRLYLGAPVCVVQQVGREKLVNRQIGGARNIRQGQAQPLADACEHGAPVVQQVVEADGYSWAMAAAGFGIQHVPQPKQPAYRGVDVVPAFQ